MPLVEGLYGDEKICLILFSLQKLAISEFLYSLPLSDCNISGDPKEKINCFKEVNIFYVVLASIGYGHKNLEK